MNHLKKLIYFFYNNYNYNFYESFFKLILDINNIIINLPISTNLAYLHIFGSFFILLSLFSIIKIIYGDYLIIKLNLTLIFRYVISLKNLF